ncbi:MAG: GvpL/GvpF family gas vesicle protein [bacterium]
MDNGINTKGLYIYGIIPNYYPAEKYRELDNINVFNISFGKVSAIVSKSSVIDYRQLGTEPLAKLLVDHQRTIENIMNMGFNAIIPMKLGTFAHNTGAVLKILERGYPLIMEVMEKIVNIIEIDVVSTWANFNQVLAQVAVHPKVIEIKSRIEKSKVRITQSEQLSVGYLVKQILDEKKAACEIRIIKALNPFCQSIRPHDVMNDQMVSNTAYLVNQSQSELFEKALDTLDLEFGDELNFKMIGPLPCYSFFTLEVNELHFEEIESARQELGLSDYTTEKTIKQAYLDHVKIFHPDTNPGNPSPIIFERINKAYQVMVDYTRAIKPTSRDDQFSLLPDAITENSILVKIRE